MSLLSQTDPEISHALYMEEKRQRETVNLIASENYASQAVLEAEGSVMTNKYAEGYPQQRYYGGCENMDIVESLAIQRTKEIFHAEHANVQPHSGAQANMAAYFALLDYGDTVMAMSLAHGGPLMHAIAAKAVAFYEAMQPNFTDYQRAILDNALVLATELQRLGMRLISGGTDTHLVLVDLTEVGVTGREAEETLGRTGIVVNRNSIPFIDTRPSRIASGIRLGTPAVTSRGFGVEEMKHIAALVVKVITNISDLDIQEQVSQEVSQLCSRFPEPGSEG